MITGYFRRFLAILMGLLFISCSTMGPSSTPSTEVVDRTPEPYDQGEFPQWSKDLRRGEIIFLGSLPLVFMLTNLAYDNINRTLYEQEGESLSFNDSEHSLNKITISLSVSGVIALADFFLGLGDKDSRDSREQELSRD